MNWVFLWLRALGFSATVPGIPLIALACISLFVILPSCALIAYLDRKLSADLQARVGPCRTGYRGMLQPVADCVKLLQKNSMHSQTLGELLWMLLHTMALYASLAAIPLGSLAMMVDTQMSVFIPFWSALVLALGTMLLGLGQYTTPGWLGGIRTAAQSLAGTFPSLIGILCVGMHAGSFRWSALAASQGFLHWTMFAHPFLLLAFVVFVGGGLVLLAIAPLDGGLAMSDIHGGVAVHVTGRQLALFQFGRFYGFFIWSVMTVVLFMGAWRIPESLRSWFLALDAEVCISVVELTWLLLKTYVLMLFILWIARANPRARVDQITDFSWGVLGPLALVALVGTAFWTMV